MTFAAVILVASLHPNAAPHDPSSAASPPAGSAVTSVSETGSDDGNLGLVMGVHAPAITSPWAFSPPLPFVGIDLPIAPSLSFVATITGAGGSSAIDGDGLDTWRASGQVDGGLRWNALVSGPVVVAVHGAVGPSASFEHARVEGLDGNTDVGGWTIGVVSRAGVGLGLRLTEVIDVDLGMDLISARVFAEELKYPTSPTPNARTGADVHLTLARMVAARVAL